MNTTNKTPAILSTLAFFVKYHQSWNSVSKDKITNRAIIRLATLGFLEINKYGQAKYTGKVW